MKTATNHFFSGRDQSSGWHPFFPLAKSGGHRSLPGSILVQQPEEIGKTEVILHWKKIYHTYVYIYIYHIYMIYIYVHGISLKHVQYTHMIYGSL